MRGPRTCSDCICSITILHAADGIGDYRPNAIRRLFLQREARVAHGFIDGGQGQVGHAVGAVGQLAIEVIFHLEILDFTRDLDEQIVYGETLNGPDAGNAPAGGAPERLFAYAVWRNNTHAGNDDTAVACLPNARVPDAHQGRLYMSRRPHLPARRRCTLIERWGVVCRYVGVPLVDIRHVGGIHK